MAFFKLVARIAPRVVAHTCGIAVHARERIVATRRWEIPRIRMGASTRAKPRVSSSGEVVLMSRQLAMSKKRIREAKSAPVLKPS